MDFAQGGNSDVLARGLIILVLSEMLSSKAGIIFRAKTKLTSQYSTFWSVRLRYCTWCFIKYPDELAPI